MELISGTHIIKNPSGATVIRKHKFTFLILSIFTGVGLSFEGLYIWAIVAALVLILTGLFSQTRIDINIETDTVTKDWFYCSTRIWNFYTLSHYSICTFDIKTDDEDYFYISLVSDDKRYLLTQFPNRDQAYQFLKEIRRALKD